MVVGLIVVLLSALAVYRLIRIQKNKNVFRKLNLKGNEIEIFEESDDSYFDKYLNEVLYLFENADADAIVFEDMDRFNANRIFERLREVNTLANIQLQKENKKPLRFFYLLRDDIFVSKDRTKFFDYIIPVVPVVDSSNSYDQFITHLKKGGILGIFNEGFLQGLSLYIDDMRLLKNIYNEFTVYYNRINTTELNCNKMLAIITYKNLFPRDFADLQLNRGFVYTLFSKKELFIRSEVETIEKSIDELKQRISSLKSEHLVSMRELNVVYADKYFSHHGWNGQSDNYLSSFIMSNLKGNGRCEYLSRKQALEDRLNERENDLYREICALEQRVVEIKDKQLSQIITRDNIDRIFSVTSINEVGKVSEFKEIKSSEYFDLLKFLVRNSFIDETYADYMTYFYENSLSRTDKTFLRSVTDKKAKEYTYQLKNTQLITSRLRLVDFDQEEILNFDLLTYLLQSAQTNYIQRLVNQLKNTKNFKFIGTYFDITTETPTYAYKDMQTFGIQIITRSGSRRLWWLSKTLWCFFGTLLFHTVLWLTVCIACLVTKAELSLVLHADIICKLFQTFSTGTAIGEIQISLLALLLPAVVSFSLCLCQMTLSLFIKPTLSFLAMAVIAIISVYLFSPLLLCNYAMPIRTELFMLSINIKYLSLNSLYLRLAK